MPNYHPNTSGLVKTNDKRGFRKGHKGYKKGAIHIKEHIKWYWQANKVEYNKWIKRLATDPRYAVHVMQMFEGKPKETKDVTHNIPQDILSLLHEESGTVDEDSK